MLSLLGWVKDARDGHEDFDDPDGVRADIEAMARADALRDDLACKVQSITQPTPEASSCLMLSK